MFKSAKQPADRAESAKVSQPEKKRRSRWRRLVIALVFLAIPLVAGRLALPSVLRWYVNRTLDQNPLYEGRIGEIEVNLWRGAYTIHDVRLIKRLGQVPVPFFAAKQLDLAIEWSALAHGSIVGKVKMVSPELNYVDAPDPSQAQTGTGPWLLLILRDLFPFRINSTEIHDGAIHFRAYQTSPPVDIYLSQLEGSIQNLTNIYDETNPLFSTVKGTALAMDQAKFQYEMRLDPFSYRPTFRMATRLTGLDVRKINDFARHYGMFDFEEGWFDLVIEVDAKEGQVSGYVKPLFRDLRIFSPLTDLKEDNAVEYFWEALVGVTTQALKNSQRSQFGTMIPFAGDLTGPNPDLPATVGNVIKNAFIRAYLPRLEGIPNSSESIHFGPGSINVDSTPDTDAL